MSSLSLSDITDKTILERVDEYSLYCFYLEFDPVIGKKYNSNIRTKDDRASFGLYSRKYGNRFTEFMWKDQGLPLPNYGDIFDLLIVLFPSINSRFEAQLKICFDFNLIEGIDESVKQLIKVPTVKPSSNIRIKSRAFTTKELLYWGQYNVSKDILDKYDVTAVDYYFKYDTDQYPYKPFTSMYAYRIYDRYQLYQPSPKFFINNYTDVCIPGYKQLSTDRRLLIVTKATKDVMTLRSLGYDAIAAKAENSNPPEALISWIQRTYKKCFVLFDNDGKTSEFKYPFDSRVVPLSTGCKDISDYCSAHGADSTSKLLIDLLC